MPSFIEFRTAKTAIEVIAEQAQSAGRRAARLGSRAAIDNIKSVSAKDLEITQATATRS